MIAVLFFVVLLVSILQVEPARLLNASTQPNFVVIEVDDQRFDSSTILNYMPNVTNWLVSQGVWFQNDSYTPTPLCCPSRTSFLTGLYSHDTGVWKNSPDVGGGVAYLDDSQTLAVWLSNSGYRTALVGKYLNGYSQLESTYIPPGWTDWYSDGGNDPYFGDTINEKGKLVTFPKTFYTTDLLGDITANLTQTLPEPFFVWWTPHAPHTPSLPPPRFANSCAVPQNFPAFRPPNFNEADISDKPPGTVSQFPMSSSQIQQMDSIRGQQICTLKAVDDNVGKIMSRLATSGRLDNTVVIYTSDNSIFWGEHRAGALGSSKDAPYEETLRVPLIVRYPSLFPQNVIDTTHFVMNIDMAPTIAQLAGVQIPVKVDGVSIVPILLDPNAAWRSSILIEMADLQPNITYGIRTWQWKYIEDGNGYFELYNEIDDPYELSNLICCTQNNTRTARGVPIVQVYGGIIYANNTNLPVIQMLHQQLTELKGNAPSQVALKNFIVNPDFEVGQFSCGNPPYGWNFTAACNGDVFNYTMTTGFLSSQAVRVSWYGIGASPILYQDFHNLKPGFDYLFWLTLRTPQQGLNNGNAPQVSVVYIDVTTGSVITGGTNQRVVSSTQWTQINPAGFVAPSSGNVRVEVFLVTKTLQGVLTHQGQVEIDATGLA